MRALISINSFRSRGVNGNNGNIVFLHAWKRFLDKYASQLNCDFIFTNNGFDPWYHDKVISPYASTTVHCPVSVPFDTDATYHLMNLFHQSYDFIFRVDHDAFPSFEHLQTLLDFLEQNPETDIVSASNFPRTIDHDRTYLKTSDNREVTMAERKNWKWIPWGYPTQNSDLLIMGTQFFRNCLGDYRRYPKIHPHLSRPYLCPFDSSFLNYGDICSLLGYQESRYEGTSETAMRIDGSINSDFWAFMCARKMNMVGITDVDGRSFMAKNHTTQYALAMTFPSFTEIRDQHDVSFPHQQNVVAPYLHIGNGYLAESYFDHPESRERIDFFINQFIGGNQSGDFGFYGAHFSIVRMLTLLSQDSTVINQLNNRMANLFQAYGIDQTKFEAFYQKITEFYRPAMAEYL